MLVLIEIPHGIKTFDLLKSFIRENYFKHSFIPWRNHLRNKISKYYFEFIQTYASLVAKEILQMVILNEVCIIKNLFENKAFIEFILWIIKYCF
jgi:hypothetical protein